MEVSKCIHLKQGCRLWEEILTLMNLRLVPEMKSNALVCSFKIFRYIFLFSKAVCQTAFCVFAQMRSRCHEPFPDDVKLPLVAIDSSLEAERHSFIPLLLFPTILLEKRLWAQLRLSSTLESELTTRLFSSFCFVEPVIGFFRWEIRNKVSEN